MAETQQEQQQQQQTQQQQQQDIHRHPEKNNAPPSRNSNNSAANNGTNAANNAGGVAQMLSIRGLRVNPGYFATVPGILKIIEWVFAIICIACAAPVLISAVHWFLFVVVICLICTFLWMCVHFFTITSLVEKAPWGLLEMIYTGVATVLYFIAMIVMLEQTDRYKPWLVVFYGSSRWDTYITAGVFALFNTVVYAVETAFHFKVWIDSRRGG